MLVKELEALLMKATWYYAEGQRDKACDIYLEALDIANNILLNNSVAAASKEDASISEKILVSRGTKQLEKSNVLSRDDIRFITQSYIPRIKALLCFISKEQKVKMAELDDNARPFIEEINFSISELFKIRNEYLRAVQIGIVDNFLDTRLMTLIYMMEQRRTVCQQDEKNYLLLMLLKAYKMVLASSRLELSKIKDTHLCISKIYRALYDAISPLNSSTTNVNKVNASDNHSLLELINSNALEHQCIFHQQTCLIFMIEFKASSDKGTKARHYVAAVQQIDFAYQSMQKKYIDFYKTLTNVAQLAKYLPIPDLTPDGRILCTDLLKHLHSLMKILDSLKCRLEAQFGLSNNTLSIDKSNLEKLMDCTEVVGNKINEVDAAINKKPLIALCDLSVVKQTIPQQVPFENFASARMLLLSSLPVPSCAEQSELTQHNNPFKLISERIYSAAFLKGCDTNYYSGVISEEYLAFWLEYIAIPGHGLFIDPDKKIVSDPVITPAVPLNSSIVAPVSNGSDAAKMPVASNTAAIRLRAAQQSNSSIVAPISSIPGNPEMPHASAVVTSLMTVLRSSGSNEAGVPSSPKTPIATPVSSPIKASSPLKRAYSQTKVQLCNAEVTNSPRKKADNKPAAEPFSIRLSA